MKRIPLFFLIALMNTAKAVELTHSEGTGNSGRGNSDNLNRLNDYNARLRSTIEESKKETGYDRMVLYTGYEEIFKKVDKPGDNRVPYGTGSGFISQLEYFPGKCIPNLTILSHGWGASRTSGGKGLPISDNSNNGYPVTGIYTDEDSRISEVQQSVNDYMKAHTDTIKKRFIELNGRVATEADLKRIAEKTFARYNETSKKFSATLSDLASKIKKRDVKFCSTCLIEIYSCNLDNDFVSKFAQTTGCQIVYGTGKVTGSVSGKSADGSPEVTLTGYKSSDKVEENGKVKYVNLNTREGNFRRLTPLRDNRGRIDEIHQDNVGTTVRNKSGNAYGYTYKFFKDNK
jgi:hypothetical protein